MDEQQMNHDPTDQAGPQSPRDTGPAPVDPLVQEIADELAGLDDSHEGELEKTSGRVAELEAEVAWMERALKQQGGAAEQLAEQRQQVRELRSRLDEAPTERPGDAGRGIDADPQEVDKLREDLHNARELLEHSVTQAGDRINAAQAQSRRLTEELEQAAQVRDRALGHSAADRQRIERLESEISLLKQHGGDLQRHDDARVESIAAELEAAQSRNEDQNTTIEKLGVAVAAAERKAGDADARADQAEQRASESAQRADEADQRVAEAEQWTEEANRQTTEANQRTEEAKQHDSETEQRFEEAQRRASEAQERGEAAEQRAAEFEQLAARAEQQLADAQWRADEAQSRFVQIEHQAEDAGRQSEAFHQQIAELQEQLDEARAAASRGSEDLGTARSDCEQAEHRAQDAAGHVESLNQQVEQLRTQLDKAHAAISRGSEDLGTARSECEQAEHRARDAAGHIESLNHQVDELRVQLDEALAAASDGQGKLAEAQSALEQSEQRAAQAEQRGEGLAAQSEQSGDAMHQMEGLLGQARQRAERLEARFTETQKMLLQTESDLVELSDRLPRAPDEEIDWVRTRRRRLAILRDSLRTRTAKMNHATDMLRDRYQQVEHMLTKRTQLAEAYHEFSDAQKKAGRRRAGAGAVLVLTGVAMVLSMLVGLSWFVAGQVAPGQYAGRVVIEAVSKTRPLTERELKEWQVYHEKLLFDPGFTQRAAERMKRRGIASLNTPGNLKLALAERMSHQSPRFGRLELELRGDGAAWTERVLDTYSIAMINTANRSRGRRADGASSAITESVSVMNEPLDRERVTFAGTLFGGSTAVTLLLGLFVWKRMADAKRNHERSKTVEAVLGDASWGSTPLKRAA